MPLVRHNGAVYKRALIQRDLSWLKSYLTMTDAQEGIELAYSAPHQFAKWLWDDIQHYREDYKHIPELYELTEDDREEFLYGPDYVYVADEYTDQLPPEKMEEFREEVAWKIQDELIAEAPTFLSVKYLETLRNQWLIHFTDAPYDIQKEGFTKGVQDLRLLALTTHLSEHEKSGGGYNFAYDLDDFMGGKGSPANPYRGWTYGDSAVMFRASGIKTYHFADDERQVIFWGPSARDIVVLRPDENCQVGEETYVEGWYVDPCTWDDSPYCAKSLEDVVWWVAANFDQYRKMLTCR